MGRKAINKIGEESINTQGLKMTIVNYNNFKDVDVKFEDETIKKCRYDCFKRGEVCNPNYRYIYGVACIGEGKYKSRNKGKYLRIYQTWISMLKRCYGDYCQKNSPTYKGCSVCEEWLNFQNFGKWFEDNYYEINNEKVELDKDILNKGNKIYSPKTCVFVPQRINTLFIKNNKNRGDLPIGVTFNKTGKCYESNCKIQNKRKYLGVFKTKEEAFNSYKQFKEQYIKEVADEYKDRIPNKLYEAMYNWEVEITD